MIFAAATVLLAAAAAGIAPTAARRSDETDEPKAVLRSVTSTRLDASTQEMTTERKQAFTKFGLQNWWFQGRGWSLSFREFIVLYAIGEHFSWGSRAPTPHDQWMQNIRLTGLWRKRCKFCGKVQKTKMTQFHRVM